MANNVLKFFLHFVIQFLPFKMIVMMMIFFRLLKNVFEDHLLRMSLTMRI
ncbi:hypothetical protein NBO_6g0119 [Nosema bombycis CQ1]|uniref:Uncharacterized protein n=1 Tax=Nosema bombycis (strain CQ1 / CVCC 102059) TaxID=578461 RepID=R0MBR0_NOSB1|nr:hypothetical protein NBO_6g0119 [Nosema bombycis CQ1]|eukprot:EOB15369.1 hypothetical protein NBO_6g0119 [Nosema bombycis CQ1]